MTDLLVDIHGLVTVRLAGLPAGIRRHLTAQLNLFCRPALRDDGCVDIDVRPGSFAGLPPVPRDALTDRLGFFVTPFGGAPAVVLIRRRRPDLVVSFGETVRILTTERSGVARRLYGMLLFAIRKVLADRGALLLHGAAAVRDGRTLLLAGPRGGKKTLVLLSLLKEGWHYLSDDKMVLHQGRLYPFQRQITIRGHHLAALPWLPATVDQGARLLRRWRRRERFRCICGRWLPQWLVPALVRATDCAAHLDVARIVPGCQVASGCRPDIGVLLTPGSGVDNGLLPAERALDLLHTMQRLAFMDTWPMEAMVSLLPTGPGGVSRRILDANLSQVPWRRFGNDALPNLLGSLRRC